MTDPTKFDDVDWHVESALAAGQPEQNAGTHIGLYLGWLVRRSLHNPDFFADEVVDAVQKREMSGSEALDAVDGKLVSDLMTPNAAAFTDWYYDIYMSDYDHHFGHKQPYTTVDDRSAQDLIDPVIDDRYAEWIAAGRPEPDRSGSNEPDPSAVDPRSIEVVLPPREAWEALDPEARVMLEAGIAGLGERGWTVSFGPGSEQLPHDAPELEAMIPTEDPYRWNSIGSQTAAKRGFTLLKRALKRLGVNPPHAMVATAFGDAGNKGGVSVTLTSVPGIQASSLDEEFRLVWTAPPGHEPRDAVRNIDGRQAHLIETNDWIEAWWARDGLVVMATAPDAETLTDLIRRLP